MYIYLLHSEQPLNGVSHYCGSAMNLERRIQRHRNNRGAALTRAWNVKGIPWKVVKTWQVEDRTLEKVLKASKNLKRYCPECSEAPLEPASANTDWVFSFGTFSPHGFCKPKIL